MGFVLVDSVSVLSECVKFKINKPDTQESVVVVLKMVSRRERVDHVLLLWNITGEGKELGMESSR